MNSFVAEGIGTGMLVFMGNGVVANVSLKKTFGNNAGWIVIAFGWAIAVFMGVIIAGPVSGAHLNPAVTVAMAILGKITWVTAGQYILAQMLGAMIGATMVYMIYRDHYFATEDRGAKLSTFCTGPAIYNTFGNFFSEAVGTFILVFTVLHLVSPEFKLGSLDALPVGLIVLGIGLSLGGITGYAINPARDLGPRIMHAVLPIPDKRDSNWTYAWIPVLGPIFGATMAAMLFGLLKG